MGAPARATGAPSRSLGAPRLATTGVVWTAPAENRSAPPATPPVGSLRSGREPNGDEPMGVADAEAGFGARGGRTGGGVRRPWLGFPKETRPALTAELGGSVPVGEEIARASGLGSPAIVVTVAPRETAVLGSDSASDWQGELHTGAEATAARVEGCAVACAASVVELGASVLTPLRLLLRRLAVNASPSNSGPSAAASVSGTQSFARSESSPAKGISSVSGLLVACASLPGDSDTDRPANAKPIVAAGLPSTSPAARDASAAGAASVLTLRAPRGPEPAWAGAGKPPPAAASAPEAASLVKLVPCWGSVSPAAVPNRARRASAGIADRMGDAPAAWEGTSALPTPARGTG